MNCWEETADDVDFLKVAKDFARYLLFLSHGSVDALKTGYYRALSITFKAAQRQSGFKIFMKVVFFMFILLFSFSPFNLIWKEQGGNDSSFLCLQNRDTWYLQPWVKSCLDKDIGYFFMASENKFFPLLLMKLLSLCVFFHAMHTSVFYYVNSPSNFHSKIRWWVSASEWGLKGCKSISFRSQMCCEHFLFIIIRQCKQNCFSGFADWSWRERVCFIRC